MPVVSCGCGTFSLSVSIKKKPLNEKITLTQQVQQFHFLVFTSLLHKTK